MPAPHIRHSKTNIIITKGIYARQSIAKHTNSVQQICLIMRTDSIWSDIANRYWRSSCNKKHLNIGVGSMKSVTVVVFPVTLVCVDVLVSCWPITSLISFSTTSRFGGEFEEKLNKCTTSMKNALHRRLKSSCSSISRLVNFKISKLPWLIFVTDSEFRSCMIWNSGI